MWRRMLIGSAVAGLLAIGIPTTTSVGFAQETTKQSAKKTGKSAKKAGKQAGEAGKQAGKTGKEAGKEAGEAGKEVGEAAKDAGKATGAAAKDMGKSIKGSVTGKRSRFTCPDGTKHSGKTKEAACAGHGA